MTEMDKLQKWLDENHIEYERRIKEEGIIDTNQILIETNEVKLSFICHYGSYGYREGLIEMYDFVEEPIGFLTADDCIKELEGKRK